MYKVEVNKSFVKDFTLKELKEIQLSPVSKNKVDLHYCSKNHELEIEDANFLNKTYQIKTNGNSYQVIISNDLDIKIKEMGFSSNNRKKVNIINSPMPGVILDITVKPGQKVKNGDVLLILEAMKMENSIVSPKDGTVKSIHSKKGKTVEKGEKLIELS